MTLKADQVIKIDFLDLEGLRDILQTLNDLGWSFEVTRLCGFWFIEVK